MPIKLLNCNNKNLFANIKIIFGLKLDNFYLKNSILILGQLFLYKKFNI